MSVAALTILAGILAASVTTSSALPVQKQQRDAFDQVDAVSLLTPPAGAADNNMMPPPELFNSQLMGDDSVDLSTNYGDVELEDTTTQDDNAAGTVPDIPLLSLFAAQQLTCRAGGQMSDCSCGANFPADFGTHTYKVNDFSQTCAHPNNAASYQCQADNHACDLYRKAITPGQFTPIPNYADHSVLAAQYPKWLVVPKFATTGVEDIANRREVTWQAARSVLPDAASHLTQLVPKWKDPASTLKTMGVAINPATSRSRHQMHIHVGKTKKDLRTQLGRKAGQTFSSLTRLNPVAGADVWAVFVPAGTQAYSNVFATASALMQPVAQAKGHGSDYTNAAHHSIMTVPAEDGTWQSGYFLVLGWDVHTEVMVCGDNPKVDIATDPQCDYFWH